MLKKTAFLVAILAFVFAGTAWAAALNPPPAYGGYQAGWGMNPNDWDNHTGSFSAWGLWNPVASGPQGADWVVGYDWPGGAPVYIDYTDITLELWIEMYALQTYEYTSYQWHRVGDNAETITFYVQGLLKSNSGQYVSLMRGTEDLGYLYFREDIFGRVGATYGSDIPITWRARWGNGLAYGQYVQEDWQTLTPGTGDLDIGPIPSCDHWFQFEGSFHLAYHVNDGYYSLITEGCPAPEM